MNGGNLRFSKGISSTGTYTGHGQDAPLAVLQDTTITLDANALTPSGSNTVSFPSVDIATKTIHLVKSGAAKSSADDIAYADPLMTFQSATLTGVATLDVGALTQVTLQAGSGTGGVIKTGPGKLNLANRNVINPDLSVTVTPNSYTGATTISTGSLSLSGGHASAISLGSGTVLEFALDELGLPISTSTGSLNLAAGSKVRITGTPIAASYTLITASSIVGTPVLETAISGYALVVNGNSIKLNSTGAGSGFGSWITGFGLAVADQDPAGDPDGDSLTNILEYVLGGNPSLRDSASIGPAASKSGSNCIFTFKRSDLSEGDTTQFVEYGVDLVAWGSYAVGASPGTGPVVIVEDSPSAALDSVTVTIPTGGAANFFVRLKVVR